MTRNDLLALAPIALSIALLEGFRSAGIELPGGILHVVAIAIAASTGGLRIGLVGAAIALVHGYAFLSTGHDLSVHVDGPVRVRVLLVTAPLVAVFAGLLRGRLQKAMAELADANRDLQARIAEKHDLADRLAALVQDQQRLVEDIALLGDMSSALQSCEDDAEAARLVSRSLAALFPDAKGTLYLLNEGGHDAEPFSAWGTNVARVPFALDECWALRQARPHRTHPESAELPCGHLDRSDSGADLCCPLTAKGEVLGVLHVHAAVGDVRSAELARSVADHLALGIANLALRKRLTIQAHRDPLTGLLNRWAMLEALEREVLRANRKNRPLSLVMIDVDHFKAFNDTYGHAAGDVALREVGKYVGGFFRGDDVVCRYGGEELVAILPEADIGQAAIRAEALRLGVENLPLELRGKRIPGVTVSVGVSSLPVHGTTVDDLLRRADLALYGAKRAGRNHVEVAKETSGSGQFAAVRPSSRPEALSGRARK